jgi:pyruvate, water dikinase
MQVLQDVQHVCGESDAARAIERGWTLLHGRGVSPGTATGSVRILSSPDEADLLQPGEVLVAPISSPDWVPTMSRAAALITWGGSPRSEAAIVAREFSIPCVILPQPACWALHTGGIVTVDGDRGLVYGGTIGGVGTAGGRRPRS